MLFSSLTFIFGFLPLVLLCYYIFKSKKIRNIILLIFSLVFYAWGEPKYIILMLFTTLVAYIGGLLIEKFEVEKNKKLKTFTLIITIVLIVGNLLYFKYINFFVENINSLFNQNFKITEILLPIGISFYTFQILSYIIDLYLKKIKIQKNFLYLMLYVSFFPQLIAGPIVRYETVEYEILNRNENYLDFISGLKRFILGLSKKVIIANNVALIADLVFDNYLPSFGTSSVWLGAMMYTFQIYFDFSGYSDMAIGLGEMFGFHFLENFNYPYISTSITEFWRRWHMSLSSWFRDYVYIPLGGNRVSKPRWIFNILIVWMLTGFWHGAAWNFIIWGLFYGVLLLLEKTVLKKVIEKIPKAIRLILTLIIITIGWTIFRANSLQELKVLLETMFIYKKTDWATILLNNLNVLKNLIYVAPAIIFSTPIIKIFNDKFYNNNLYKIISNILILLLFLICIIFLLGSSYNPFIYFRF